MTPEGQMLMPMCLAPQNFCPQYQHYAAYPDLAQQAAAQQYDASAQHAAVAAYHAGFAQAHMAQYQAATGQQYQQYLYPAQEAPGSPGWPGGDAGSSTHGSSAHASKKGHQRRRNHNEDTTWNEWEQQDWYNQNWSEASGKQSKNRKWKSAGGRAPEESSEVPKGHRAPAEAVPAVPAPVGPRSQTFYEKRKGKEETKGTRGAAKEMDLVATTVETVDEPAETSRAWRSNRVKQRKAKEKDEEKSPEKPEGKEKSGGWGDGLTREVKVSKTLTQILRHKALELEINIRPDGYCYLQKVLDCPWLAELEVTKEDVQQVVKRSDKKRFELKDEDGEVLIRAVQGHSMKVIDDDQLLKKLDLTNLPDCCVHGTYRKYFESIKKEGLLAGGGQGQGFRNHVHFSAFPPGDKRVISGMRYDCEIAIWIDLKRAIEDEVPFYMSTNQVILSPGINGKIDKKYFKKARDLHKKEDLPL